MSRSRRHKPIKSMTLAESEKHDKMLAHRAARRLAHQLIKAGSEDMPHPKQHGNPWLCAKDGRVWFDMIQHPKLMRK